jgi:hypothetical protein
MAHLIDLTGKRFGRWLVLGKGAGTHSLTRWRCRCDCGHIRIVIGINLRRGASMSCGCGDLEPHHRKLTDEQVKAIRLDRRSQSVIAREYGIAQAGISLIKSGRRWRRLLEVPGQRRDDQHNEQEADDAGRAVAPAA